MILFFLNYFFCTLAIHLFMKIMVGKINFDEIIVSDQIFLYVAIFLVLLAIFGAIKLMQLMKKVKKQKVKLQNLVKDYEAFLKQREGE